MKEMGVTFTVYSEEAGYIESKTEEFR